MGTFLSYGTWVRFFSPIGERDGYIMRQTDGETYVIMSQNQTYEVRAIDIIAHSV